MSETRPDDPSTGGWISQDWSRFNGRDTNLGRYCGNSPATLTDPSGLAPAFGGLVAALDGIANSAEARAEAAAIAAAIQNTWSNNWTLYVPWAQTTWGYWCYEWAYAFEVAANGEDPTNFTVNVYSAAADDGRIHAWIKITSNETGKSVYVDDGFWDGTYVHSAPPCGGDYKNIMRGVDVPREQCSPPPAYSSGYQPPNFWALWSLPGPI
jgi:hypothetical protein